MAHTLGTDGWARALTDAINSSSDYRSAAARWGEGFRGDVVLVFEADETLAAECRLLIRLSGGACHGADFVAAGEPADAGFVLRAPASLWRRILARETPVVSVILTGRMKVEGDTMILLRHTAAHRALVHCATSVDTIWPAG